MKKNKEKILEAKKIAIFGWPATGKSTFGKYLSELSEIPLYPLDLLRWNNMKGNQKDDEQFLVEYNKILSKDEWIIEGNALDWISSRLEQADMLFFFESTTEKCIDNYKLRQQNIENGIEKRINFVKEDKPMEETINWIKNRYSKKIDALRLQLKDYDDKLIIINDYEDLDKILKEIGSEVIR